MVHEKDVFEAVIHTNTSEITLKDKKTTEEKIDFSSDEAFVSVETILEGGLWAFRLSGGVKGKQPPFGYQPYLASQKGIAIRIKRESGNNFVCVYQHKEWWTRPAFGSSCKEIPENSQLIVFQNQQDYEVFLTVAGKDNRCDIAGNEEGLTVSLSSNLSNQQNISDVAFVYGRGTNPYEVIEDAASLALKLTHKNLQLRKDKPFPELFESIGWCTWDSLGQDVSEKAIMDKMDEFQKLGIPIPWVLIDDGWSWVNQESKKLMGLDADREKFPNGIAGTIKILKEQYHVKYVGVWQAIKGYWNGIARDSEAEKILAPYLMEYGNGEITMIPTPEKAFGFWNTWHAYLKQAGVDFIKVDSQSSFSIMCEGQYSYGSAAKAIHTGLAASATLNFNGNLINCMGMAPEDLWNRQNTALSRNSDDFTPTVADSFGEHAISNAYNSIYHGCFYWGDWDMVWSKHEDSKLNNLLRVMSGGPLYYSDGMQSTDTEAIWPEIKDDGGLLRCSDVARPTLDCLCNPGVLETRPLKIYNSLKGVFYIAAFTYSRNRAEVKDLIRDGDLPMELPNKMWLFHPKTKMAQIIGEKFEYGYSMGAKDAELYQLIPYDWPLTVVGMVDKYLSNAAIEYVEHSGNLYFVRVNCVGTLGFLSEKEIKEVRQGGHTLQMEKFDCLTCVKCNNMEEIITIEL